jgi:hypothetical protein
MLRNEHRACGLGVGAMRSFGNTIYWFGCVVAATLLVIGVFDYWFGDHHLSAFLSWAALAAVPWLIGWLSGSLGRGFSE